jgi:putative hemolysin
VLSEIRPDVKLLVGKALHVMLGMQDLTIPVDNFTQSLSKESFKNIRDHLENEGVIVLFPTRAYSDLIKGKTVDHAWKGSFFKFALEKNAPILPIYIGGRNSRAYYYLITIGLNYFSKQLWTRELIQLKMMREIFSQHTNNHIPMLVGDMIDAKEIDQQYDAFHEKIAAVRERLYALETKL